MSSDFIWVAGNRVDKSFLISNDFKCNTKQNEPVHKSMNKKKGYEKLTPTNRRRIFLTYFSFRKVYFSSGGKRIKS